MAENSNISDKIDMLIQVCKANYKLNKAVIDSVSNVNSGIMKRFDLTEKQLVELKNEIQKTDKLLSGDFHVYSDEEIFNLKKSLSWNKLSKKTNIPLSTLQYRYRRYLKQNGGKNYD